MRKTPEQARAGTASTDSHAGTSCRSRRPPRRKPRKRTWRSSASPAAIMAAAVGGTVSPGRRARRCTVHACCSTESRNTTAASKAPSFSCAPSGRHVAARRHAAGAVQQHVLPRRDCIKPLLPTPQLTKPQSMTWGSDEARGTWTWTARHPKIAVCLHAGERGTTSTTARLWPRAGRAAELKRSAEAPRRGGQCRLRQLRRGLCVRTAARLQAWSQ